jgi:hypothetical protein
VANIGMVFGYICHVSANVAGGSIKNPAINIQPLRVVILCEKIFCHLGLLYSMAAHSSAVPRSSHHGIPAARVLTAGARSGTASDITQQWGSTEQSKLRNVLSNSLSTNR